MAQPFTPGRCELGLHSPSIDSRVPKPTKNRNANSIWYSHTVTNHTTNQTRRGLNASTADETSLVHRGMDVDKRVKSQPRKQLEHPMCKLLCDAQFISAHDAHPTPAHTDICLCVLCAWVNCILRQLDLCATLHAGICFAPVNGLSFAQQPQSRPSRSESGIHRRVLYDASTTGSAV